MEDKKLYEKILDLKTPWIISDIELLIEELKVIITLRHDPDIRCVCPKCGEECSVYDHRVREWRHLDSCEFVTIIKAYIPRTECPEHGVCQISVPWAKMKSRFTIQFEELVSSWLLDS